MKTKFSCHPEPAEGHQSSVACLSGRQVSRKSGTLSAFFIFLLTTLLLTTYDSFAQGVGINATGNPAHSSAGLDVDFTNKGFLCPRITTAQRDAIGTPAEGLFIFNTTTKCYEGYVNGGWYTIACPAACTPPAAPVDNAASDIACTSFTANWSASPGATAYLLDVATDAGFTSFVAGYNNLNVGNVTSSPVSGLAAGTPYYYRVRATTACVSGNSGTQNPTTSSAPTSAPTAGTHTPSQTQIVWNWNAVAGATGYQWNTSITYPGVGVNVVASTTKTQTGLTCNTAYTLYVWVYNACGYYATPVTLTQTTTNCCDACPNVKILLHADGAGNSFTDNSCNPHAITTNADVTQSVTQSKFGGKSAYFDGTGDILKANNSADWDFGTGDFTIDYWLYYTSGNYQFTIDNNASITLANAQLAIVISGGVLAVHASGTIIGSVSYSSTNVWDHIAVTRSSGTVRLFVNGTIQDTQSYALAISSEMLHIGNFTDAWNTQGLVGYIDEVRISKGCARWTSNFTPPSTPYNP